LFSIVEIANILNEGWNLSAGPRNLRLLPLEQLFVSASCADQHDLVDPFRNAMAVRSGATFPALAHRQLLLHLDR
jgi:hypothetical protein